ncbi:MAG: PDDEXK nuclease domain-containing protein [Candidatus Methylomirabilia bacterium]
MSVEKSKSSPPQLYERIREILESARTNVARSVNTTQVIANWHVGREILEEEQRGKFRATYGKRLVEDLSQRLRVEYGAGYSAQNLWLMRQFYMSYPQLVQAAGIPHAPRRELTDPANSLPAEILYALRGELWQPGFLNPNLSWTHYRTLLRVEKPQARAFYEIESIKTAWSARELERQINSLLYERLALSKDKKGLMRLSLKGQEIQQPADVFKDPVVVEFLGLPESPRLVESRLEEALIGNLQAFLLELGKGFAFVSRQERITLDGDHFYIDLVFYHTVLKCYILIDLKTGKLTHGDLGQIQFYVNYFDRERRTEGDNPTLGLILCTDKNDAVVKYTLGPDQKRAIFASRYKLHLPTEAELKAELKREMREFGGGKTPEE